MVKKDSKYKYKNNTSTSTKKFVAGTQSLNYAPDYSNLYNAQDNVYNRRTREMAISSSVQPVTSSMLNNSTNLSAGQKSGIQAGTAVASTVGDALVTSSVNNDATVNVGKAVGGNALKYGAMGASAGAAAGPIGAAIGGAVGAIGGGIYGGVTATKQNKIIAQGKRNDTIENNFLKAASQKYNYNLQGDINSEISKVEGFAGKGKYKLKSEVKVTKNTPDDSKSSREMLKSYKRSDPNRYKLRTNKSVIVKTFK